MHWINSATSLFKLLSPTSYHHYLFLFLFYRVQQRCSMPKHVAFTLSLLRLGAEKARWCSEYRRHTLNLGGASKRGGLCLRSRAMLPPYHTPGIVLRPVKTMQRSRQYGIFRPNPMSTSVRSVLIIRSLITHSGVFQGWIDNNNTNSVSSLYALDSGAVIVSRDTPETIRSKIVILLERATSLGQRATQQPSSKIYISTLNANRF